MPTARAEETLRQLLGVSADDDDDDSNPRGASSSSARGGSRDSISNDDDNENPAMYAINAVAQMIRNAEKNHHCIDDYFHHEHYLFSCDGNGAYYIISHFTMAITPPGAPVLSVLTSAVLRCHDNFRDSIFLPTEAQNSGPYFQQFLEDRRNEGGVDFRRVPYRLCSNLIVECLQRMKRSHKILQGKEARTVARLYGLPTRDPFHQVAPTLPPPSPPPNVDSIWILLNRPEYFFFSYNEDLHRCFKIDAGSMVIDPTKLQQAMRYITKDDYRRNRVYAMFQHMAVWHTVGGERQIASWLLWERAAMLKFTDRASAIQAMESNIVFQLVINKFFHPGTGPRFAPQFPELGEYGRGLTNYFLFQADLRERGSLPPNILCTASIADSAAAAATSGSASSDKNNDDHDNSLVGISKLSKDLTRTKGSCALCGATTAKEGGGPLMECARCHSVAYCGKEHQVLHWRKGRHRQECTPDL